MFKWIIWITNQLVQLNFTLSEMEGLYHQTNSLLEQTQGYFVRLEQGGGGGSEDGERLQAEIQSRLETMWSNTERLDMLASKEPVQRRQVARQKIDQLKYDIQHLHAALQVRINKTQWSYDAIDTSIGFNSLN